MSNLLIAQFWFNQSPGALIPAMALLLLGIIIFFLLAAIVSFILCQRKGFYRPLWYKTMNFFASNAIIGVVLYFFSQQMIPFLSARIWFAFWAIGMAAWMILIIIYAKKLPAKKKLLNQEKIFKKYLP
ncbi:MAG: hypothetical protein PHE24_00340 [Patescibacteria group bacterium]|nr:hypothetical protein [Patescibacteria group bacterium]